MHARRVVRAAVLTALVLTVPARAGEAPPLRIPQVETSLAGRDVRVSTHLSPGLPAEVGKRLASGLPTTVDWEVRLFVSRDKWWDGLRGERSYGVTATWRPVSGDYAVERRLDGHLLETTVVPGREEAEKALSTLPALPCFTMGRDLAGEPLVVRVRCVYGTGMWLGILPTRTMTDWRRSSVFFWKEPGEAP